MVVTLVIVCVFFGIVWLGCWCGYYLFFGFLGNENLSVFLDSGLDVEACKMSENWEC